MARLRIAAILVALGASLPAGAGPVVDTPVASASVTFLGNIPEAGVVGGRVRTVQTLYGERRYFVVTGARGVSAYDVTVPEVPLLGSHLPLPHFSNEDVDFGEDILIVSVDPQWVDMATEPGTLGGLYLIDISRLPLLSFAYTNPATGNRWVDPVRNSAGHTTSCITADCSYAHVNGRREIALVDLTDPADPEVVRFFGAAAGSTHDSNLDEAGIVWQVGSGGIAGYDVSDPRDERVIAGPFGDGLGYHHNSLRPRAAEFVPRSTGFDDPDVRPGELLLITEETFWPWDQLACNGQGRFATYRLRDTDDIGSGAKATIDKLDEWETELQVAGAAAPAVLCSAHYFTERDGIVAIGWYEQGVRFLDVSDPRDIRQVGWFIPHQAEAFGAYWIGPGTATGEIVYTTDLARGIDVLLFDRANASAGAAPLPTVASDATVRSHPVWGIACALARV